MTPPHIAADPYRFTATVRQSGNSVAITLPPELRRYADLQLGDTLVLEVDPETLAVRVQESVRYEHEQ